MTRAGARAAVIGAVSVLTATLLVPVADAAKVSTRSAKGAPAGGMWLLDSGGGVHAVAGAPFRGSLANRRLNAAVVSLAATRSGNGYWIVATDGGVFTFGDARFHGSTGDVRLNRPIVGITPTPSGRGYWLVASDGGIFSFGDARFYGSTGSLVLNRPIVGMTPTVSGRGYWLVAADGGVFTFGDARFYGSTASTNASVVGLARTSDGRGYWISTQRSQIFGFGDAHRFANRASVPLAAGVVPTEKGDGYWTAMQDGQVRASGAAGRIAATRAGSPIISVATRWASSGSGSNAAGPVSGPSAALTFDDGPNPTYTPQILAALASAGVPATFFTVGYEGIVRPDLLADEARDGHSVQDHTWGHPDLTRLSAAGVADELRRTAELIEQATGIRPACFRPPYRATNDTVVSVGASLGLAQVLWNVDPQDWSRPGADVIASNVLSHSTGQDVVIIMHDGGGDRSQTVAALPAIIGGLRSRGYHFRRLCA